MATTENIHQVNYGALPLSLDVLRKSRIGLWAFELDEGRPPRMYGDEAMLELIEADASETPEEIYHSWYDRIDPDHYGEVHEAVDLMATGHAEVQYPWHCADGRTIIVRCGGVRNPAYTKGLRIEGVHRDVTELAHFEKEKELTAQLHQDMELISGLASEYLALYYINLKENSFRVYSVDGVRLSDTKRLLTENRGMDVFAMFRKFAGSDAVHPDDRELFAGLTPKGVVERLTGSKKFTVRFRRNYGNGYLWSEMDVIKSEAPDEPANAIAVGFAERDKEIRNEMRQQATLQKALDEAGNANRLLTEQKMLLNYFVESFSSAYSVNLQDDTYEVQHMDERFAPYFKKGGVREDARRFIDEYVHPDDRAAIRQIVSGDYIPRRLETEKSFTFTMREVLDGGTRTMRGVVIRGIDVYHAAVGFLDIGEELRREREIQEKLQSALDMAQSADRAKTEFLFNMSHDIRTPLNAILGYTDIGIRHAADVGRVKDSLQKIRESGGHLLGLINDILEMSRIESGKLKLTEAPLDVRRAIEGIADMSRTLAVAKSIDFRTEVGEIRDPYLLADELHVNEVLINLISNAIKYTPEGGRVVYRVEQVGGVTDGKALYRFEVSDNGIGMSEEFQKHLFENFTREENALASRTEGAGLGLSIVHRIVDLAGGSITVKSKQGEGSVFTVEIPFRVTDMQAVSDSRKAVSADVGANASLGNRRVLLVEDNEMNREIATDVLTEAGLRVETAEDGEIAVQLFEEKGAGYYDLILMDIQMPVMNGYEATRAIRKTPGGDKVPIIALSANAFEEDVRKSLEEGMNAHVAKPIDIQNLFETMRRLTKDAAL